MNRVLAALIFAALSFSTQANQPLQEGNGINPYVNNVCNNTLPNSWVVWVEVIREGAVPNGTCVDTMPTAAQIVSKFNTQFGGATSEFEAVWCNQLSTTWQINAGTGTTFYSGQAGTTSIVVQAGQCVTMIYWLASKTPGAEVVQIATNATAGTAKTPPTPITGAAPVTISAATLVNGYLWRQSVLGAQPSALGASDAAVCGQTAIDVAVDQLPTAAQIVSAAHGLTQFDVSVNPNFIVYCNNTNYCSGGYAFQAGAGITFAGALSCNGNLMASNAMDSLFFGATNWFAEPGQRILHFFITNSTAGHEAVTISN